MRTKKNSAYQALPLVFWAAEKLFVEFKPPSQNSGLLSLCSDLFNWVSMHELIFHSWRSLRRRGLGLAFPL